MAWTSTNGSLRGPQGPQGVQGPPGTKWLTGSGPPLAGVGVLSDWYLDSATSDAYEKLAGGWTLRANLRGAQGPAVDTSAFARRDEVPALGETFVSVPLLFPGEPNMLNLTSGTSRENALFVAPFPLTLTTAWLTTNNNVNISTTAYWTFDLERTDAAGADNEVLISRTDSRAAGIWGDNSFELIGAMNASTKLLGTGQILHIQCTPTGAPAALESVVVTVGYRRQ
jgi:hypothetical protein